MDISNPELRLAEEFVQNTNCHIYLTGKAGTGKTTFLHNLGKRTPKRLIVTAPTGVAAINAGGVTLHSFFQIPFGPFIPGGESPSSRHRIRGEKMDLIRSLDLLVIDEISMVRADLLDAVDSILRRYRRSERPFGGVQLLMIGDLLQLPPVVKKAEWEILGKYYDSPYFFSSFALGRTELIPIELDRIYRQSDHRFIELLNRVRDDRLDASTLARLNSRHIPGFSDRQREGYITLCTHNHRADAINISRLKALPGKSFRYEAELGGEFPDQAYPTAATLELKTGAQVMFIRNDATTEKKYYNGKIGEITGMSGDAIKVRCPGESGEITVDKSVWENIEYTVDPKTAEISRNVIGTFSQYPLRLAWAITIHKSQGLTFEKTVIDAQSAFAHGQVYVALSRCRTLEGIVLSSPISRMAMKADPAIRRFAAEAAKNKPTEEMCAAAKIRYEQQLLLECFNFDTLRRLLGRLVMLLRSSAAAVQVASGCDLIAAQQRAAVDIFEVGDKFRRQLQGMFVESVQPAEDPAVLTRLLKASIYFQDKLKSLLLNCLESFAFETDNKEIRKKLKAAEKQLKEEAAIRLAGILSCRDGFSPTKYLRALSTAAIDAGQASGKSGMKANTVIYSEADVGHPVLFDRLREWRARKAAEQKVPAFHVLHQKTLIQIAIHLPDSMDSLKSIRGIGPRLAERYGLELIALVADYRQKHGIKTVLLPEPPARAPVENRSRKRHLSCNAG